MTTMESAKPSLLIEPPTELAFVGPFTQVVSSVMRLTNPSDQQVCFKIKTTAPKRYCVKPNSGIVEPRQAVQISVSLQPFDFDPNEKNRHKFMVQSMYAPEGDISQETLWKESDPSQMADWKLKCTFILPEENNAGGEHASAASASASSGQGNAQEIKQESKQEKTAAPMIAGENDNLRKTVEEIKKLQEEVSNLRQENIQLKEEALRQKRLAASRGPDADSGFSGSGSESAMSGADSAAYSSTLVTASNPSANALSTTYIYAAVFVLLLGVIIGKWIL